MKNRVLTLLTMLVVFMPLQAEIRLEDECQSECEPCRLIPTAFYFGGLGGVNFQESCKQTIFSLYDTTLEVKTSWDPGYLVGGFLGYRFCNGWQLEGEVSYKKNTIQQISVNGVAVDIGGCNSSLSFIINSYLNFFSLLSSPPI